MLPLLLKTLFQTLFANFRNGRLLKKRRTLFTVAALAALPILIVTQTSDMFYAWLLMPNLGIEFLSRFVATSLLGVMVLLTLTGLPGVMHHFFLAPDLDFLSTLPIRRRDVFLLKFLHAAVNNTGMFIAIGLPILISMGIALGASPLFYLLIVVCSMLFILIPTALAALIAFALAMLFSIKKMRRVSTLILGLFILLAWAGFQFVRVSRLNPMMADYQPKAVESMSAFMARIGSVSLPSDWVVSAIHSAHAGEWNFVLVNVAFLIGIAFILMTLVIFWRIKLQLRDIRIETSPRKHKSSTGASMGKKSITYAMLTKDFRLMFRDTRFFQSSFLLMAMLLLVPLFTVAEVVNSEETLAFLMPYIPVTILSLIVSSTLARQSVPMERLSFVWMLVSPLKIKNMLIAKWLRIVLMVAPISIISVLTTAFKSDTVEHAFFMLIMHLGCVICGASLGMANAAFTTQFDWNDPRYMANPASVYLSSLIVLIFGAAGMAIGIVGLLLHQQIIAFLIFFVYVFLVFWMSLRAAESRLLKLDWIY